MSDTAVAGPLAESHWQQPSPMFYICTVFGSKTKLEVPSALRGVRKDSGTFKLWLRAKWRETRRQLAARGNIAACESIKKEARRKILWQRAPGTKEHRARVAREQRRVRAQQIARERDAALLAETRRHLEELKQRLKEQREQRHAKQAERGGRI